MGLVGAPYGCILPGSLASGPCRAGPLTSRPGRERLRVGLAWISYSLVLPGHLPHRRRQPGPTRTKAKGKSKVKGITRTKIHDDGEEDEDEDKYDDGDEEDEEEDEDDGDGSMEG